MENINLIQSGTSTSSQRTSADNVVVVVSQNTIIQHPPAVIPPVDPPVDPGNPPVDPPVDPPVVVPQIVNQIESVISATDFGAIGDGVTDSTVAIQAALDAAGAKLDAAQAAGLSGESKVHLPGGSYLISATLFVPNGISFYGDTDVVPYPNRLSGFRSNNNLFTGTEILCANAFVGDYAVSLGADNTVVKNMIIDGHSINKGSVWSQVNVRTANGKFISTSFIKFNVGDTSDFRQKSSLGFDNIEIPTFVQGTYGEFYLSGKGGQNTYTYSLMAGSTLPAGLTLGSDGLISGNPTVNGEFFVSFTVADGSTTFTRSFPIGVIIDEIKDNSVLPSTSGSSYNFQLSSRENAAGVTWAAKGLPSFYDISSGGMITNNRATTNDDVGEATVEFNLLDSNSNIIDTRAMKLEHRFDSAEIKFYGENTEVATIGQAYNYLVQASGGNGSYNLTIDVARTNLEGGNTSTVTSTTPLPGLTLNPTANTISGTTTVAGKNKVWFRMESSVTPTLFSQFAITFSSVVSNVQPLLYSRSFKPAVKGQPYSHNISVQQVAAAMPYTYEAINLPSGLVMNEATGEITGTPLGANFVSGVRIQWSTNVVDCAIRGFASGAAINSNQNASNVHRIIGCSLSACDSGFRVSSLCFDSHFYDNYIYNCRVGMDLADGAAGLTISDTRIEYCHEDGVKMVNAHENNFDSIYWDTCGWSSLRATGCRNLMITSSRSYRSGRNVRGTGTKLNTKANRDYSNHFYFENCDRMTMNGNGLDVGTLDGGDGIFLSDKLIDFVRPLIGLRVYNSKEMTVVGNNLTGCKGNSFDANLTSFGTNSFKGSLLEGNTHTDGLLVPLDAAEADRKLTIPNASFDVWERDVEFNLPTSAAFTSFPIADFWSLSRGVDSTVDQVINAKLVEEDGKTHIEINKPANTVAGAQTVRLNNNKTKGIEYTSRKSVVLSFWAKSTTSTVVTPFVSQYADSADNGFAAFQKQAGNVTLTSSWKRYSSYFELESLEDVKSFGDNAAFNLGFNFYDGTVLNASIRDVQVDFVNQTPYAQKFRKVKTAETLKEARKYYQKSKLDGLYFPSYVGGLRYDVNGANWQPGFRATSSFSTTGALVKATVPFKSPISKVPATGLRAAWDYLQVLNPPEITNSDLGIRNSWRGTDDSNLAVTIASADEGGFIINSNGETTVANQEYLFHWLYSTYDNDYA